MNIIGIDPGLSGAIALVGSTPGHVMLWDMPTIEVLRNNKKKRDIDHRHIYELFRSVLPGTAFVERVGSMPGQGVSSTFAFGRAAGIAIGIFAGLGWVIREVLPQRWKKHFNLVGTEKAASLGAAIDLFPHEDHFFTRMKDTGRSDAALIAVYGKSTL